MRLIRKKFGTKTSSYMEAMSKRLGADSPSVLLDTLALVTLRGNGLPTDARLDALVAFYAKATKTSELIVGLVLRKRNSVFKDLVKLQLFQLMLDDTTLSPVDKVEQLFIALRNMNRACQQSQCMTCMYRPECAFGQSYGSRVRDVRVVVDPDATKSVHENCPHRPELTFMGQVQQGMTKLTQLAQQQAAEATAGAVDQDDGDANGSSSQQMSQVMQAGGETDPNLQQDNELPEVSESEDFTIVGPSGPSSGTGTLHTASYKKGNGFLATAQDISKLSAAQLALFEVGRRLNHLLSTERKGHYKPVPTVGQRIDVETIESVGEASKATANEHAAVDDVFYGRVAGHSLQKNQHHDPETAKHALHILLDVSCSMRSNFGSFNFYPGMVLSKAALAALLAIAVSRRVESEQGHMMMRTFDNGPGPLIKASVATQFDHLRNVVSVCGFNGGGTSIVAALDAGIRDIKALGKTSPLGKCELLLITDGEDSDLAANLGRFRTDLGDIVLNVLDASGSRNADLEALADIYLAPAGGAVRLEDLITLVNKTKKARS